ncbi:MAG: phosphoribosylglycinamide formyltransferase [Cellvibrionales bacterium]|jgi:phosphoribosylglycinamide formyltransferase-1|nr:phosphoribosylglycinamide formyltransferase [Cellvibrionales bacterium]MBT5923709.1 phosphoribosylglycinamide formyltransferase [Cellvibrionales bacterium]
MLDKQASKKSRIVVLISGSGSNLQAIIDGCQHRQINAEVAMVISNRPGVFGLQRAEQAGIANVCIDHKLFASREDFDKALNDKLKELNADLIVLAGFMRILTPTFVTNFIGKLVNIHPSLLPKYPGLNTHQRAIDDGESKAGVTVHFVTPELDGGPAIIQAPVSIETNDDASSLAAKVLIEEHRIYPLAISWFIDGRLSLTHGKATLDNEILPSHGAKNSSNAQ